MKEEPHEVYHASNAISKSGLDQVARSVAHYLAARQQPTDTRALRLGRAIHTLVLDGRDAFEAEVAIPPTFHTKDGRPSDSLRTAEAQEWLKQVEREGRTPVSQSEIGPVLGAAEAVLSHSTARALLDHSLFREQSFYWQDELLDIPCRCRPDAVAEIDGMTIGLDLKTARDASADAFVRSCARFRYGLQWAFYAEGMRAHDIELDAWVIIAVEKEPPYGVAVYELDIVWRTIGETQMARDLERFAGWWHDRDSHAGYPLDVQILTAPSWA